MFAAGQQWHCATCTAPNGADRGRCCQCGLAPPCKGTGWLAVAAATAAVGLGLQPLWMWVKFCQEEPLLPVQFCPAVDIRQWPVAEGEVSIEVAAAAGPGCGQGWPRQGRRQVFALAISKL